MKRPWSAVALSLVLASVCSPTLADELESPDHRTQPRVVQVNAYEVKRVPKTRVYIEAHNKTEAEVVAFRRQLIADGAEKVNLFLPAVIVCEIPVDMSPSTLISDPAFSYVDESQLGSSRVAAMSDNMRWAQRGYEMAWEAVHGGRAALVPGDDFKDAVYRVPADAVRDSRDLPRPQRALANFRPKNSNQNSEFLIGDVLVRMVLPESNGGIDVNKENWTEQWLTNAISGGSAACLSFQESFNYIPINYIFDPHREVPTRYEPIIHDSDDDGATWVMDTMESLGFGGRKDDFSAVHAFNEDGRARFGTDWVYTAFIANSRLEPGNIFSGGTGGAGYTAYAYLGGPYLVLPYPAGANDPYELGEVLLYSKIYQHEMVHTFWGLDEYPAAPGQCSSHSGYLDYLHGNKVSQGPDGSVSGCPNILPCIMWGARENDGRPVCKFTAGQIGVVDSSPQNNVPDVFDSRPIIEFMNSAVETVTTPEATLRIRVTSLPVINRNPFHDPLDRIDYAARLRSATLTVAGTNALLKPDDGKWDETVEDLSFTFTGLTAGLTRVNVTATNVFGLESVVFQKKLYFIGLNFGQFDFDVRSGAIDVNFNLVGETFGASLDLYRVHNGEVQLLAEGLAGEPQVNSPFTHYRYIDKDVAPGSSYVYYVMGSFDIVVQGQPINFATSSGDFEVTAMVPMAQGDFLSLGAPNPFVDRTSISIRVPETRADIITTPNASAPRDEGPQRLPTRPVPTQVEVNVYDVAGRMVKGIFQGGLFEQVYTVEWDGTNHNGTPVASGIYFIKAVAGPQTSTRKVVIVR